ncbi:MAG: hypothetical protein MRY63_01770 [Neomegalonema sp.]|nr:hypothetical protein [Neomegalonema sp.]
MLRLRLRPLGKDYWPDDERHPWLRLVLAFIGAPLPFAATSIALIWWTYAGTESDPREALKLTQQMTVMLLILTYGLVLGGGAIAFPLLWSLRLRSAIAYFLTGAGLGFLLAGALMMQGGEQNRVAIGFLGIMGGVVFLLFRWIAGIRRDPDAFDLDLEAEHEL